MSTSSDSFRNVMQMPVKAFEYRRAASADNTVSAQAMEVEQEVEAPVHNSVPTVTEHDVAAAYQKGRQEGRQEAEILFREQMAQAVSAERTRVGKVVEEFQRNSSEYYSKVEDQVVHLALAIAAKILHREAHVDPMLVAALVKIATESLKEGSKVQVNIPPGIIDAWRNYFEREGSGRIKIELVEDPTLAPGDCVLQSEVGVASLGIAAQIKEIERGLFDLLAQRPTND